MRKFFNIITFRQYNYGNNVNPMYQADPNVCYYNNQAPNQYNYNLESYNYTPNFEGQYGDQSNNYYPNVQQNNGNIDYQDGNIQNKEDNNQKDLEHPY